MIEFLGAIVGWGRGSHAVTGTFLVIVGAWVLASRRTTLLRVFSYHRWARATATVVESAVDTSDPTVDGGRSGRLPVRTVGRYRPQVRYEYVVDGERYVGDRVACTDGRYGRLRWVQAVLERYPYDARIPMRYDPTDPSCSALQNLSPTDSALRLAGGAVAVLTGLWVAAGAPLSNALPAVVGIGLTAWASRELARGVRSVAWPTATAYVLDAAVHVRRERGDAVYAPYLRYEYRVRDETFVGGRLAFGGTGSYTDRASAESALREYSAGAQTSVRYDPRSPSVAVVRPGVAIGALVPLGLGLFCTTLGLWLLV